jgi:hypothetical protein
VEKGKRPDENLTGGGWVGGWVVVRVKKAERR